MLKKEKEGKDGGKKRNCQPNFDTFSSALVFLAIYLFIYFFVVECIDTILQTLMIEPKKVKLNNVKHRYIAEFKNQTKETETNCSQRS